MKPFGFDTKFAFKKERHTIKFAPHEIGQVQITNMPA